jgi:hypothetical protein
MTYSEQMCGWIDRIAEKAMRYMPEGADRYYVEAMVEQYKETVRAVEGAREHRQGDAKKPVAEAAQQRSA